MHILKRATLAVTAAAALVIPVSVIGTATPATAHATCNRAAPPDYDPIESANTVIGDSTNIRSGSGTNCSIRGQAHRGHRLDYHCYTVGEDDRTWTYVRNTTTGVNGWIRDDLLSDVGSWHYCGF